MIPAAALRLVFEDSLTHLQRCLCPSSASPRSWCAMTCALVQRMYSSSRESMCVLRATTFEFAVANNGTSHRNPSALAMLPAAAWRLLFDSSLSQRRRCLCPSSAFLRSGCAQVQRHCFFICGEKVCSLGGHLRIRRCLLAPHTSGPRDVPRCGALSLLQKTQHYRGDSAEIAPTLNVKLRDS